MKGIPLTPATSEVARRVIWFEPPEQALAEPIRFMAYAMTFARHEDMRVIRRYVSDDDIREALDLAPPGIIDARSWAYWNSKVGRYPAPPLPVRQFGAAHEKNKRPSRSEVSISDFNSAQKSDLDSQRILAREKGLHAREGEPSKLDPEDARRKAREDWRHKYAKWMADRK